MPIRVLSRDDVVHRVWGRRPLEATRDRLVDAYVLKLRRKVDEAASTQTFLVTR